MEKYIAEERDSLKNFTDNHSAQASFCFRTLLKNREIRVNGKKVGENVLLEAGDEVCYFLTERQKAKRAFSVLYEDDSIVIADKESGVNSEAVFSALRRGGECYFIHRLDRNTEGLMAFAKTKSAAEELLSAFSERRVTKVYSALVKGVPQKAHDLARAYLKKDGENALVTVSLKPIGEEIVTEYEIAERRGDCTLLKVVLHTGKTHQIRAHLAFLGLPVVGDEKYGDHAFNRQKGAARQKLLAKELIFTLDGALSYLNGRKFVSDKML